MRQQVEGTSRDETLAMSFYSGYALPMPYIHITSFNYTISKRSPLDRFAAAFADELEKGVSAEHRALLESGERQSEHDIAVATRMLAVQQEIAES